MDEQQKSPESIWRKSWKGPGAILLFLLIISIAGFALAFCIAAVTFAWTPLLDREPDAGYAVWCILELIAAFIGILAVILILYATSRWLFYWLFSWRIVKRLAFASACLVTVLALFYAEEDWRGQHDWAKYKREEAAIGERFDWQSVVPAPVPDDQNFAFSPVWIAEIKVNFGYETNRSEAWYGNRIYNDDVSKLASLVPVSPSGLVGTNWWSQRIPALPELSSLWPMGQFTDLKPWQTYYRALAKTNALAGIPITAQPQSPARDVLLALSKFDPVIEKERQDSALPYSRFPIGYDTPMPASILLPHLAALVQHSEVLQLRASAELQLRENDQAFADVKLILRLNEAAHTESFLISQLVRLTIVNRAIQVIWEGLATQEWSAAQLADLDSELARLDFLADFSFAVRGQRALEIADIEYFQHPRNLSSNISPFFRTVQMLEDMQGGNDTQENPTPSQILMLGLGPSGWLDQNKLRAARFETKWYLPVLDEGAKTISPSRLRAALAVFHQETQPPTPENLFERMSFDSGWHNDAQNEAQKFAGAQSSVNLARVAIALERYRLAHGEYPESLAVLSPQFLPEILHDVINGQPLKYRREPNGQFVLYSVGWNETDDGGVVVLNKGTNPGVNFDEGDWVWRYPSRN
jgi:hypothetical protein